MKTSKNNTRQELKEFVKWLNKSYHYKVGHKEVKFSSGYSYGKFLSMAIEDFGMKISDLLYSSPGVLKAILKRLEESKGFDRKDEKMQSNIVSAFKAFIKYRYATSK